MAFDVGRNTTFRRQEMPSYKVAALSLHSAAIVLQICIHALLNCVHHYVYKSAQSCVQLYVLQAQRPEHPRDILLQEPLALAMMTALGCPCYSMVSVTRLRCDAYNCVIKIL
jgi:hypothetical protein